MIKEILARDNRSYSFSRGIIWPEVQDLLLYSHTDGAVGKFTSDPRRFSGQLDYLNWLEKGKRVYTLSREGRLLGVLWFGADIIPKASYIANLDRRSKYFTTLAVRVYGEARGSGVAYPFMTMSIGDFQSGLVNPVGLWLSVRDDNMAAIKLYEKVGFVKIAEDNKRRKLLMIAH